MSDSTIPMKLCTKCHQELPATLEFFYKDNCLKSGLTSRCRKCCNKASSKWSQENPEKVRQAREQNKEHFTTRSRQYAEENREKIRTYNKKWREENKEKLKADKREWAKNHPRKRKPASERSNEERQKFNVYTQKRRARKRSLPDTFTHAEWLDCLEYFHYCCAVCGCQLRDLFGEIEPHQDHWMPLSSPDCKGTVIDNIVCLCSKCNMNKKAKLPEQWLIERYGTKKAEQILRRIDTYFLWAKSVTSRR